MVFVTSLGDYQFVIFKCSLDYSFDLTKVKRFHQIIKSAESQSADCALHRLHAADHYHDGVGRKLLDVRDHLKSAHARHGDIAYHQMKIGGAQAVERLFGRARFKAFVVLAQQVGENRSEEHTSELQSRLHLVC